MGSGRYGRISLPGPALSFAPFVCCLLGVLSTASGQSSLGTAPAALHPTAGASTPSSASSGNFVKRNGTQLQLDGKPFYFAGANYYSAMVDAAGGSTTRQQTTEIFQTMQNLGLTVLRTWAFNDLSVNNTWQVLQSAPGVFNETVFSEGLDWIISEAPKYGVKLLLTLTNYQIGYGGAYQYVQWANGTSILDFYSDPAISGWYQTNVRTIVTRVNSITGIKYSDDPAIFAWELINEPGVPGDDTGSILTNWIDQQSQYIKSLDSNHLVTTGHQGYYGVSTPSRLADNPSPPLTSSANGGNPAPYAAICEGQDFTANHQPEGVDITMIHIYPDFMTSAGNLTMQLEFTQQYIQGHMDESQKLNKPLVIGEIGKEPPLADRNTYFSSVFQTAMQSAASGGTLAGTLIWQLGTSPQFPYVEGYDAFNIYPDAAPYSEPPPEGYTPPTQYALLVAQNDEFYGWANKIACNAKYVTQPQGLLSSAPSPSDGWNTTLALIQQYSAAVAATNAGNTPSMMQGNASLQPITASG